jgi:hypothetical protein
VMIVLKTESLIQLVPAQTEPITMVSNFAQSVVKFVPLV